MVHLKMAKENVDFKKLQTDLEQQELEVFLQLPRLILKSYMSFNFSDSEVMINFKDYENLYQLELSLQLFI